jgi:hypothetical protein
MRSHSRSSGRSCITALIQVSHRHVSLEYCEAENPLFRRRRKSPLDHWVSFNSLFGVFCCVACFVHSEGPSRAQG